MAKDTNVCRSRFVLTSPEVILTFESFLQLSLNTSRACFHVSISPQLIMYIFCVRRGCRSFVWEEDLEILTFLQEHELCEDKDFCGLS